IKADWHLARTPPGGTLRDTETTRDRREPMNVLVAYATRHGATRGIAERIAETLERHGLDTVLLPADQVRDPRAFDAFVIGSAAYQHHWLKPAADLARSNARLLASRPTWLFSSG